MTEIQLVAQRVAFKQPFAMVPELGTLSDRAWYAWHCLPRTGKRGAPPPWKHLEKDRLAPTTLSRLFSGERKSVDLKTLPKLALALNVDELWLYKGVGEPPKLTGPFEPRQERYAEFDPAAWAARAEAAGGVDAIVTPSNPFEAAVQTLLLELSPETIKEVADEAKGHETEKPAHHWGRILRDRERERRGPPPEKRAPSPKSKAPHTEKRDERRRKAG